MLEKPWQEQLRQMLAGLQASKDRLRVAVLGVGHELCGDDAAGVAIARCLKGRAHSPDLQVIEAGAAPENCCGLLFRFHPDLVVFVDAAHMAAEPGAVHWLPWRDLDGFNGSTHTISLRILANYLTDELDCSVVLLGIQPADISMGALLSPAVAMAVEDTALALADLLSVIEGATVS